MFKHCWDGEVYGNIRLPNLCFLKLQLPLCMANCLVVTRYNLFTAGGIRFFFLHLIACALLSTSISYLMILVCLCPKKGKLDESHAWQYVEQRKFIKTQHLRMNCINFFFAFFLFLNYFSYPIYCCRCIFVVPGYL